MTMAASAMTDCFTVDRYILKLAKNNFDGASYAADTLSVADTASRERLSLSFRNDTKKLIVVYRSRDLQCLSFKYLSGEKESSAARWNQRSTTPHSAHFRELVFDGHGMMVKDFSSSSAETVFFDFLNEQEFMRTIRTALDKVDDGEFSAMVKQTKSDILSYLDANIENAAFDQKKRPA